jgi:SAM-dependent methyltransferase
MKTSIARLTLFLFALALAQAASAFEPTEGQEGKDVVWLPSSEIVVEKMLDMARVGRNDFLIDLGSGDGRTVIAAARRGARALGIEYEEDMIQLSRRRAESAGVSSRATFRKADLFDTDLSGATVITLFLLPQINLKLRPKILALRPGTRIVSNSFDMGDWHPDESANLTGQPGCNNSYCRPMLWIVPAHADGIYPTEHGTFVLKQEFQVLSGTLNRDGRSSPLLGKLRGSEISLVVDGREYKGRMNGTRLEVK